MICRISLFAVCAILLYSCSSGHSQQQAQKVGNAELHIVIDQDQQSLSVMRKGGEDTLLTQHARADFRPYIHPIAAPDGKGILTEYSPGHHKHQTGLYWGFTQVNGRDYFHHPGEGYWRKVAAHTIQEEGDEVQWQTIYELLDERGEVLMLETQTWTMRERDGKDR